MKLSKDFFLHRRALAAEDNVAEDTVVAQNVAEQNPVVGNE